MSTTRVEIITTAREARSAGYAGIAEWADHLAAEAIAADAAADEGRRAAEAEAAESLATARSAFVRARDARHKFLLRYADVILPTYAEAATRYQAAQRVARSLRIGEGEAAFDNVIAAAQSGDGGYKLRQELVRIQTAMAQGI